MRQSLNGIPRKHARPVPSQVAWHSPTAGQIHLWPECFRCTAQSARRSAYLHFTIAVCEQRQLIMFSGEPAGSPGYSSSSPPTSNGSSRSPSCPCTSICSSRARGGSREDNQDFFSTTPLCSQAVTSPAP